MSVVDPATVAIWERVASGSPLLVMIVLVGLVALWKHLTAREAKWDAERATNAAKWDAERREEQAARERMVREVVGAIEKNTETQRVNTGMIASLRDAIEERTPPHPTGVRYTVDTTPRHAG